MSLAAGDQAQIIGVGVAALFALGAAIWKTASLRGDVNARWARRVDFAAAALDEQTIRELEALRDEVDAVLPEGAFDPVQAIADPAPLSRRAERAVGLHRTRTRMESAVGGLMLLARAAIGALGTMALGTACATAHYAELWGWPPLGPAAFALLAVSFASLVVIGGRYIVLQDRLASAEERAGTAGRAEQSAP